MAKQKKNSNYVTEKTAAAKAEREAAKVKEKQQKNIKIIAICVAAALVFVGAVLGILAAVGAFEYDPEPTYHATVNFDNGSALHIELYGNDAPKTVEHFIDLCEKGYFEGLSARKFLDEMLYIGSSTADGGSKGVKGEFSSNGVENKIPMKKGTVCLARGEGNDSGYGQFFVLTKNNSKLSGNYAAFGKITDIEAVSELISDCEIADSGVINDSPKILSVSLHEAHH